jgi:CRP-like cAMP-binding protein
LLRHSRRQLYHAGLLADGRKRRGRVGQRLSPQQALSELVLFESLEPDVVESLAQQVVTRLVEPGETLFGEGTADCTLHVVASGVIDVTKSGGAGDVVTLGRLGAGEYLGEIGLLTGAPHAATARARTHCQVHELSRAAIQPLLAANPGMVAAFERSARHGMDLINRRVAASASVQMDNRGEFLTRIREFFAMRFVG